jgi:hypothetical protein
MATVIRRNEKWQARVTRTGPATRAESFQNRSDAFRWVRKIERDDDRGALACDPAALDRTTVVDLLLRYRAGSVCLNSFRAVAKWIPALVRLPSGSMTAH